MSTIATTTAPTAEPTAEEEHAASLAAYRALMGTFRAARRTGMRPDNQDKAAWDAFFAASEAAIHEAQERGAMTTRRQVYAEIANLRTASHHVSRYASQLLWQLAEVERALGEVAHPNPQGWADPFRHVYYPLAWVLQELNPGRTSARKDLRKHVEMALTRLTEISGFRYVAAPVEGQEGEG